MQGKKTTKERIHLSSKINISFLYLLQTTSTLTPDGEKPLEKPERMYWSLRMRMFQILEVWGGGREKRRWKQF